MAGTPKNPLKALQVIPGVGPSIAQDLLDLGIVRVSDLKGKNPELLYDARCVQMGQRIDRCLLYVFRCAVYYASATRHDPEKLKWWNWTDERMGPAPQNPKRSTRSTRA